ncbi:unnamed protein product, partial [Didymodactylos carnosus]
MSSVGPFRKQFQHMIIHGDQVKEIDVDETDDLVTLQGKIISRFHPQKIDFEVMQAQWWNSNRKR